MGMKERRSPAGLAGSVRAQDIRLVRLQYPQNHLEQARRAQPGPTIGGSYKEGTSLSQHDWGHHIFRQVCKLASGKEHVCRRNGMREKPQKHFLSGVGILRTELRI